MGQGTRRAGRELALKVLYSLYDHDTEIDGILSDFWASFCFSNDVLGEAVEENHAPVPGHVRAFAEELVRGVVDDLERIDAAIAECSTNWALDRMARVDLSLLRMATHELMNNPEVPASVVINEAIEIGKRYGTKDTPPFINGILDKLSRQLRSESK